MALLLMPLWIAPAAMKQAPIVGVTGVGSGKTINAKPICMSRDLLPSRQSFLVVAASRELPFIPWYRSL